MSGAWIVGGALAAGALLLATPATAAATTLSLPRGHDASEAHVAVSPTDPNDVLVLSRDVPPGESYAVGLQSWRSRDGGRTFTRRPLVEGRLAGSDADVSDPVALFDTDGTPLPLFLAFRYGRTFWKTSLHLGPQTVVRTRYGPPLPGPLIEVPASRTWHDKPWAAIDPATRRRWVAWIQIRTSRRGASRLTIASALPGAPFSPRRVLFDDAGAPQVLVRSDGSIHLVWLHGEDPDDSVPIEVRHSRSLDGGATWSAPATLARLHGGGDPPLPALASDAAGRVVACWSDGRGFKRERLACARSDDGAAWSPPAPVTPALRGAWELQPAVAGQGDGRFHLIAYRARRSSTEVVLLRSIDGGATWSDHSVLARRDFSPRKFNFIGDYQGLAAAPERVYAAFVLPRRPLGKGRVVFAAVPTP